MRILLIVFILSNFQVHAERPIWTAPYSMQHVRDSLDLTLKEDQSVFEIDFKGLLPEDSFATVQYSIDGLESTMALENGHITIQTTPGVHNFMFYINDNYYELISDILEIQPQSRSYYYANLTQYPNPGLDAITYKPVIYLYPEVETEVNVKLEIDGNAPFYYPEYHNGWKVLAKPNGELKIDDENLRYLFWEAHQKDHLASIDLKKGFIVNGSDALSFLESKLTEVGFTSAEKADFITFWGPQIAQNNKNFVRFEWNEVCDKFARIDITPTPDHLYRFYIFISPIEAEIEVSPQDLPSFTRNGFTVLEWGGQRSNQLNTKAL